MEAMKRILIVDDDLMVAKVMGDLFSATGLYEVRTVNDPRAAVAAALEFRPDILVLDVVMPQMDGGEVLTAMRAQPALAGVPAIFLTGLVSEAEVSETGGLSGDVPVIAKPVRPEVIRMMVADLLSS